ncbi:Armadillo [Artemisia annua]|uniref:Armadillo n=1 Tax=Artemisia annua TaxID=35608 RepID=A0A2U1Q5P1_ARTAN|nr:Armadillo [Artemisia annua]
MVGRYSVARDVNNEEDRFVFLTFSKDEKDKGKEKVVEGREISHPVGSEGDIPILLFVKLLKQPLFLRSIAHLEQVMGLLQVVVDKVMLREMVARYSGSAPDYKARSLFGNSHRLNNRRNGLGFDRQTGKEKVVEGREISHPVGSEGDIPILLFVKLLKQPLFLRSIAHLEQVMGLLQVVVYTAASKLESQSHTEKLVASSQVQEAVSQPQEDFFQQ